ncbi:MAG: hypothetical protein QOE94_1132 [Mycobacterium sp.]|jgi:hypothetical protein|nr:hypothetical protein [Mycobacterium sp.]
MFKVVTRAGQHECQGARQDRCGQFEGQSRLAADGNAQQSAVAAVWLEVVVLNPGVKRRCGRAVDTKRKTCAFIPGEDRLLNFDTSDPLFTARANTVWPRRVVTACSVEAGEELAPVGRVMCTSLGGRPTLTTAPRRLGAVLRKSRSTASQANMRISLRV